METLTIDVDQIKSPKTDAKYQPQKPLKRKRPSIQPTVLSPEQVEAKIEAFSKEIHSLLGFYKEFMNRNWGFVDLTSTEFNSMDARIGVLLEESELPLSKLVNVIYERVKEMGDNVTPATVKNTSLYVGQRMMYGVPNAEADVLEDEAEMSLWCWETRDLKLMPKSARRTLQIRRHCRKRIQERITAVSEMITALGKSEGDQNYKRNLMKGSVKLDKALSEAEIRLLVDSMLQKNDANMSEKEAKREEKLLIKQLERNKQEAEKEKKRIDRELLKEKLQNEKELKRLQEETGKDERLRQKEEAEMRKQLRKQQEETEKAQRRREKEEVELKRQLGIQKQASILERFLKRSKTNSSCQNDQSLSNATTSDSSSKKSEKMPKAVTLLMDSAFLSSDGFNIDDIRMLHLSSWHHLGDCIRSNTKQSWGIRQKPKTKLFKELKLSSNGVGCDDEFSIEKLEDGSEDQISNDQSCHSNSYSYLPDIKKCKGRKQLLQFAKSYRPAFYGIWPKKSHVVGPRHPLRRDPDLDYENDSDEEWEEEDPGESLSDCDKDEEGLEEGCSKADDEDESEDGFFVPDGYLSENEGAQVDRMETDISVDEARSSPSCKPDLENEFCALLRQQKYLHSLTEQALRKNQPLIVSNLMHEKTELLLSEDLSGTPRLEQMCLQALCMCSFPGGPPVEISVSNVKDDDQVTCLPISKGCTTPVSTVIAIPDSDLPTVVSTIQSCSQGINKVVESLQQKFPAIPKTQLRNKVRELSDFVDNRWQVKKEILNELGLSPSPEKGGGGKMKNIASFFSKRCMPPAGKCQP